MESRSNKENESTVENSAENTETTVEDPFEAFGQSVALDSQLPF